MMVKMKIQDAIISLDCCWMLVESVTQHCMMHVDADWCSCEYSYMV